jgi:hypothetical protein
MSRVARCGLGVLLPLISAAVARAQLINSEWNTANGNWNVAANWLPVDVPDNGAGRTYSVNIGNRPVAAGAVVTYIPEDTPNDIVSSLTITGGAEFYTNGNHLNVFGQTIVEGANSKIRIGPHHNPHASAFFSYGLVVNSGGALLVSGGAVEIRDLIQVNAGATLAGPGDILAGDLAVHSGSNVVTTGPLLLDTATTQIDAGAVLMGGGSLMIPAGSSLQIANGAHVGLLTQNSGALSIGLETAAQATGLAYRQNATGSWHVDVDGLTSGDFDRLIVSGTAQLAGTLQLAIGGGYVPAPGDTIGVLSAGGGVSGAFASIVQPDGLPADLAFEVRYEPTVAQLVVVNALPGDYNRNGAVDAADYVVWRKTLGQVATMFTGADGNGDGTIDNDDFAIWRGNFGTTVTPGSGAGNHPAVPEPPTYLLLVMLIAWARSNWHNRLRK